MQQGAAAGGAETHRLPDLPRNRRQLRLGSSRQQSPEHEGEWICQALAGGEHSQALAAAGREEGSRQLPLPTAAVCRVGRCGGTGCEQLAATCAGAIAATSYTFPLPKAELESSETCLSQIPRLSRLLRKHVLPPPAGLCAVAMACCSQAEPHFRV